MSEGLAFQSGQTVSGFYTVTDKMSCLTREGQPFLELMLCDDKGFIKAFIWDDVLEWNALFKAGDCVKVMGALKTLKGQPQLHIQSLRQACKQDPCETLLEKHNSEVQNAEDALGRIENLINALSSEPLKKLSLVFLDDQAFKKSFVMSAATAHQHHAYPGGLIKHTLNVMQTVHFLSGQYETLSRDLLVTAAFLHDIGRMKELDPDHQGAMTTEGQLKGHVLLGFEWVQEALRSVEGFPCEMQLQLEHILLSHHGRLQAGAVCVPKTREAFVLHYADVMDADMTSVDCIIREDAHLRETFTSYNSRFKRQFFKDQIG